MRNSKQLFWLLTLSLGTALLLPVGLAAQDDTPDQPSGDETAATPADQQQRHREFHQRWRARLKEQRADVKESRRTYREAVKEYGKDSPEARAARRLLNREQRQAKTAQKRFTQRHQRFHRRLRPRGGLN